uniref:protein DEK-like n=1 Tax=Styela clava TaxID=7725 RepID=UPI00193A5AEE|nr:protein DEK-like [Styela clava]
MSETEPQKAVEHEEKVEPEAQEVETEPKAELTQKVDQSETEQSVADESTIVDSSINAEKSDANVGDDEQSDSDSDESLPPGLLERPVEILEAKRERKKIKRFTYDDEATSPAVDKKKNVEIPKGSGIRIGNHPRVEYQLQRNSAEDLKIIHKFFYNVQGTHLACKKNIREFCGFNIQKGTPEYEKKEEFIGKFTVDNLKWAMSVCDVPSIKGNKEELIDAFMAWCLCPKPQDKPVPEKKKKKDPTQKKKRTKKIKRSANAVENGDATSDGATPVKKRKKKENADEKKKKTPSKTPAKKSTPNKKAKIKITKPKSKSKITSGVDDDTSDDEPLMHKQKTPPSNAEVRKFIENCLQDADLGALTMKAVILQVYEQYPEFDLTDKKGFIKETVKKIIS